MITRQFEMTKQNSTKSKTKSTRGRRPRPQIQVSLTLDQKLDILGVALILVGFLTLASQLSFSQGAVTALWLTFLDRAFGWGVYAVPLVMMAVGLWLLLRTFESVPRPSAEQTFGFVVLYVTILATLQAAAMWAYNASPEAVIEAGAGGGQLGEGVRQALVNGLGNIGAVVVLSAAWLIGLVTCLNISPGRIIGVVVTAWMRLRPGPLQQSPLVINGRATSDEPSPAANGQRAASSQQRAPQPPREAPPPPSPLQPPRIIGAEESPFAPPTGPLYRQPPAGQVWKLPDVAEIFEVGNEGAMSEEDIRVKANVIEETLHSLGVEGKVIEVNRGPVITQFGVEPGFITARDGKQTKVKVSKITALADDLALALAAKTIRIEAPVPGRSIVGIEVPNSEIALVSLRDVIESEPFQKSKSSLRIALGQDVSGQAVTADLAAMPHLLIAGTTGSGKSVCINAVIACLLAFNTPDDLRFIMVDPKRVELTTYNGIPHLMAPVVVDLERVVGTLQWVTREMDTRYRKFAKAGARNIDDYNLKVAGNARLAARAGKAEPKNGEPDAELKMPYIVVVIDELADLMMLAPDETERTICRLAQMARATGIHLIIATQRPSVDVVTGLIKANFPARISFAVASSVDSRVILDQPGAERLLGRGDMLFVSPESGQPLRLQGCYVADRELQKLTRYWKGMRGTDIGAPPEEAHPEPPPVQPPLWEEMRAAMEKEQASGSDDDLFERAVEVVRMQKKASISLLQRHLRIGYTRAARLIDLLEERGIVGPSEPGSRWREVIMTGYTGGTGSGKVV